MNVLVDPDRCQGHARCWEICPEVFGLDDEGHSVVLVAEVPAELEAQVSRAASNCPERAIILNRI
jgi:ferredoxin